VIWPLPPILIVKSIKLWWAWYNGLKKNDCLSAHPFKKNPGPLSARLKLTLPPLAPYCHVIVTVDGVWIGNSIYWTLWYSAWLQFTFHYYTHTFPQSRLYYPLLGSGFQQRIFHFFWVPELSSTSLSQQQLKTTEPQRLSYQLTPLHCCCCLKLKLLLSNGCYIAAFSRSLRSNGPTYHINPIYILPSYFFKFRSNIILPSTPKSSKWSLTLKFSYHEVPRFSVPVTCSLSGPNIFITLFSNTLRLYSIFSMNIEYLFCTISCKGQNKVKRYAFVLASSTFRSLALLST
jgi:hypothetical protein